MVRLNNNVKVWYDRSDKVIISREDVMSQTANTLIVIFRTAQEEGKAGITATGGFEFWDHAAFVQWYVLGERLRATDADEYARTLKLLRTYYRK